MRTTVINLLNSKSPIAVGIFRVVVGLMFLAHGASSVFGFPHGPAVPIATWPYWWSGALEISLGALVALGLFTRQAAFLAAGEMAVAYFWMHFPESFWPRENGGEAAILFCFAFALLLFTGPGAGAARREHLEDNPNL